MISIRRSVTAALFAPLLALMIIASLTSPLAAQNQPGRILSTPNNNIIIQCNLDNSNCFTVVGYAEGNNGVASPQSPSVASNGIAFSAAAAVDGSCSGPCYPHIFIMNSDGTNVRQLTFNVNSANYNGEHYPAISPDATMVAFLTHINAAPDGSYPNQIYLVNADGSNMRQLTPFMVGPDGSSQGYMDGMAWSPDSKSLAFRGAVYTSLCGTYFNNPIWVNVIGSIKADGTSMQVLACDNNDGYVTSIDWSPDGNLLAWTRNVDHGAQGNSGAVGEPAIAFLDLSGQGRYSSGITSTQLNTDSCQDTHCIHFSPDSTQLAYKVEYPNNGGPCYGACNISMITLDGINLTETTIPIGTDLWWMPGPAIPAPAQMTLAPTTLEFWPGFSQQLTPSLRDGSGDLIMHTANVFNLPVTYYPQCTTQIGPYGLMTASVNPGGPNTPLVSATNAGLTSDGIPFKCWNSPPCTYNLAFNGENFGSSGGPGSVGVMADPGQNSSACPWNAMSNAGWITITSPANGSGAGSNSVSFTVAANNGAQRQGTMTIAGQTFTVTQDAFNTVTLQSISVSPASASVPAGLTQQFTATGHYSDSSTQGLTTSVTWSSSDPSTATISNAGGSQGRATGAAAGGPVTITALQNGVSGTAQLTVTAPVLQTITVAPSGASIAAGLTQPFSATGHYSDSSTQTLTTSVTWSSSNASIATISNSGGTQGLATGVTAGGPVTITAALNGISGTAQLNVTAPVLASIAVTPANPSVPTGSNEQFTATGSYSDGSQQNITGSVTWTSSNTTVATINASSGLASALALGATTIKAAAGAISASTTMTAITLQSITIAPVGPSILVGSTQQFIATGHYSDGNTRDLTSNAAWTSMKTNVATITSPGGLATGAARGSTTIRAAIGAISSSTTLTVSPAVLQSITVAPATTMISIRGTLQFSATGHYSNGTTQDLTNSASWSASPKMVASVSSVGLATGLKPGTASISAKSGGVTGSATLTVQ